VEAGPQTRPGLRAWRILAAAVVAQTGISVVDQGIPTLTGYIKADLGVSAAGAGLVISAYTLGRVFGAYGAGLAADRFGERRVLIAGSVGGGSLVAVASLLPLPALLPVFTLAGLLGVASTPAGGRLVLLAFPRNRHGLALGIRQTGIPAGGLVAAALLPWLAHTWSWRLALAVAAAIAVLTALPIAVTGRRGREDVPRQAPVRAARGPSPLRDRDLWLLNIWGVLLVSGQWALITFLALDLHQRAGVSLATASLLVVVAQAFGIAGRAGWGALSDHALRYGRKPLLLALTVCGLASALLLWATPSSASLVVFVPVAALAGLALIGYQGLWITMVAEIAGPRRVGAATGLSVTLSQFAIFASPPLFGLVADTTGSYRSIWAALAVVLALSFIPALLVREAREAETAGQPA
jgi:predicted MFS family arabinose efflux permease